MRRAIAVPVSFLLPSLLAAMPTLALYLDDNEQQAGIRARRTMNFSVTPAGWWGDRLDPLYPMSTPAPPLYLDLLEEPDLWTTRTIRLDRSDFRSLSEMGGIEPSLIFGMIVGGMYRPIHKRVEMPLGRIREERPVAAGHELHEGEHEREEVYVPAGREEKTREEPPVKLGKR